MEGGKIMSKIKVGDYVRIDNDFRVIALGIGKVIRINKDAIYVKNKFELPFSFKRENITKNSKNIIDLIEERRYSRMFYKFFIYQNNKSARIYRSKNQHKIFRRRWI